MLQRGPKMSYRLELSEYALITERSSTNEARCKSDRFYERQSN